jgi:hypothetical protein
VVGFIDELLGTHHASSRTPSLLGKATSR